MRPIGAEIFESNEDGIKQLIVITGDKKVLYIGLLE